MAKRKEHKKGTIDYPVSTRYRSNWGQWDAVREIVQNAIDTRTRVTITKKGTTTTIRDRGDGFALRNLIIGEGTKDGIDSIGKFGEGMKFAMLALLRNGCKIRMQTNGTVIEPRLSEMFEVETLSLDWKEVSVHIKGTKVEIVGLTHDYSGRFLSLRYEENVRPRVLMGKEHRGMLFVKGIYVKRIDAVAGYNINAERANPLSGDVDMVEVKRHVAALIAKAKDREYVDRLLDVIDDESKAGYVEAECGRYHPWRMRHPVVWREQVANRYGRLVCRVTNLDAAREAVYKGWHTISTDVPFAKAVLKTDVKVAPQRADMLRQRVSKKAISSKGRANVNWAKRLIEAACKVKIADVRIMKFDDGKRGEAVRGKYISISEDIVDNKQQVLATMMHEFVHYRWGWPDLSHEFQEGIGKVAAQVAMHLAGGGAVKAKTKSKKPSAGKEAQRSAIRIMWRDRAAKYGDMDRLKGMLHNENMNSLAQIAAAFGVAPVGKKRGPLVVEIANAIANDK